MADEAGRKQLAVLVSALLQGCGILSRATPKGADARGATAGWRRCFIQHQCHWPLITTPDPLSPTNGSSKGL